MKKAEPEEALSKELSKSRMYRFRFKKDKSIEIFKKSFQ